MKLIYRVAQDELDPGQLKTARVRLKYRRENGGWGNCQLGTPLAPRVVMMIGLPRKGPVDSVQIAKVIAHELGHARGLQHRDMRNTRYGWVVGWRDVYSYATDFPITEKATLSKADKLALRRAELAANADKMVAKYERQLKRDDNLLKKWKLRAKLAKRRIAKAIADALPVVPLPVLSEEPTPVVLVDVA